MIDGLSPRAILILTMLVVYPITMVRIVRGTYFHRGSLAREVIQLILLQIVAVGLVMGWPG